MVQLRPGDLVAVQHGNAYVLFAVITKQILFGGHWCFVFHGPQSALPANGNRVSGPGFNAAVDFIVPKREKRVFQISKGNDFSSLGGPDLLKQSPLRGEANYRIWRWMNGKREDAEYVRFTTSPTPEEMSAPHYSCIRADFACELAKRGWKETSSMWDVQQAPG
jgi:hypothetical protein